MIEYFATVYPKIQTMIDKNGNVYIFAGRGCGKTELVRKLNAERMALSSQPHCDAARRYITERDKWQVTIR